VSVVAKAAGFNFSKIPRKVLVNYPRMVRIPLVGKIGKPDGQNEEPRER
jgi:hypothetical protein